MSSRTVQYTCVQHWPLPVAKGRDGDGYPQHGDNRQSQSL